MKSNRNSMAYVHTVCGNTTCMPAGIVTNLIADPYYYHPSKTICAHCGDVPNNECFIVDTGMSLSDYRKELQKTKGTAYHTINVFLHLLVIVFCVASLYFIAEFNPHGKFQNPRGVIIGAVIGLVVCRPAAKIVRLVLCRLHVI